MSVESLDFLLDIRELVFSDLKVSRGTKRHILHLNKGSVILIFDLNDFVLGILVDLVHRLFVISLHSNDVLFQVGDLLFLFTDLILVVLLLLVDLFSVLFVDGSLSVSELPGL